MVSRFIIIPFILCNFSLFGMDAPKTNNTKKRKYKTDILQFLQQVKLNHTTLENSFQKLLEINLDNQSEACDLINQLRLEMTQDVDVKIKFLDQLLDNYPPKKKQKVEVPEKSEQNKKPEILPALKNALLEMIVVQKETAITAQNNMNRLTNTLEIINGSAKAKPLPDLMYI